MQEIFLDVDRRKRPNIEIIINGKILNLMSQTNKQTRSIMGILHRCLKEEGLDRQKDVILRLSITDLPNCS